MCAVSEYMAFFISVHSVFTYKADRRAAGFGNVEALCSRDPNDTPPCTKCTRQHNDLKENTILGMRIPRDNISQYHRDICGRLFSCPYVLI